MTGGRGADYKWNAYNNFHFAAIHPGKPDYHFFIYKYTAEFSQSNSCSVQYTNIEGE